MGEEELDGLFAEVRASTPLPSGGLVRRVEATALAEQARRVASRPAPRSAPRSALVPRVARWFGGLGITAGLATATLAGVWLGAVQPAGLTSVTDSVSQVFGVSAQLDRVDLIPTFDSYMAEG